MLKKKFVNVIALGSRDYYKVAEALKDDNSLGCLVTDFYCPDFLRGAIKKRFSNSISHNKTVGLWPILELLSLFLSLIIRDKSKKNMKLDFIFGFLSGLITYIQKKDAIVYSYYLKGFYSFLRIFKIKNIKYLVFQVHPTPWFVSEIIKKDQQKHIKNFGNYFRKEQDENWSKKDIDIYMTALNCSQGIICASNITKLSIGNTKNKITVIPYGSRFKSSQSNNKINRNRNEKLKLITVASPSQRKGLHHAFRALYKCNDIDWMIIGNNPDPEIVRLAPKWVQFIDRVTDEDLRIYLSSSDLFIMPSLIEGFGLVYIEAISQGTPILCSTNTGLADVIKDYDSGFVVTPGEPDEIIQRINWVKNNYDKLPSMADKAKINVESMTWINFKKEIARTVLTSINKE